MYVYMKDQDTNTEHCRGKYVYVHMYDRYTNVCKVYIYMNVIMYGYI